MGKLVVVLFVSCSICRNIHLLNKVNTLLFPSGTCMRIFVILWSGCENRAWVKIAGAGYDSLSIVQLVLYVSYLILRCFGTQGSLHSLYLFQQYEVLKLCDISGAVN